MADDDTKKSPGSKSWSKFDARLAALAAVTAGHRPAPIEDSMRPFDATGQPGKVAPLDKPMSPFDAKVAAMLAEANSGRATATATAAGLIEAESKPAASDDVEGELARPSGAAAEPVRPAETAEEIARRIAAELASENELPPPRPPGTEGEPRRAADIEHDLVSRLDSDVEPRAVALHREAPPLADIEPKPADALKIEPELDRALRIDPEHGPPAPVVPEAVRRPDPEPTRRDDVEAELTRLVEEKEAAPPRPVDMETAGTAALLGAVLVIGLATVRDYGISAEEFAYDAFGAKALAGYRDAFADLASPIYAPWFQAVTALVQSFGFASAFDVRHAATFVIGLLGLLALLPIGRLTVGRWAGLVAIVLCLMTGALYGQLFFSPVDIPFMAAMTWATLAVVVMVRRELPAWWATIGAGLFAGLAIATRPDGILIEIYLLVAVLLCALEILLRGSERKGRALLGLAARLVVAFALADVVAVALSPWLQGPDALAQWKSSFSQFLASGGDGKVQSWGRELSSARLPWSYLPGELLARLPEGFLILLALTLLAAIASTLEFLVGCVRKIGQQGLRGLKTTALLLAFLLARSRGALVVVMAALVPLGIVMYLRPPLGEGIQHLIYVIPPLAIIAAWGLLRLKPLIRRFPVGAAAIAGTAIAWAVIALIVLHPLEYVATNALAGGTRGSHGRFDLDYRGAAATEALRRLEQRLAYDTSGRYALRTPSILICMPGQESLVTPMFKRAWVIESDPKKADFIIETERMRCGKGSEGVVIDEVKRFDVPFAWTIETAARIPNQDRVSD